ncbi:ABI gene family member 3 isoform X2 [Struthio camelus]|uniref:ABI gene family member 3 isoform X2 n=1 Tax=Struthio camelus TaxID=8801 RepID=UPI003603B8A6
MAELQQLQQRDIPAARRLLRDNRSNLGQVADYCESNYVQASDKRKALEETMAYSTQSLASVAYQISNLATSFLKMLDLQAAQLRRVEADISCVAQMVDMHKEKVSRREIGSLTVGKRLPCQQKITAPANPPSLEPYYRKPLNFGVLDDVGHGVKDHSTQLSRTGTLSRKGIKSAVPAAGTLGRGLRVPEPIQPPVVPEGKLSAASSTSSLASASSSAASGPAGDGVLAPPPPVPPAPALAAVPPPPPPPLPGDLPPSGDLPPPPPPLGDLDLVPPGDLDLPPPGDLDLVPPGDLDLPPPGDLDLPPPGDLDLPPPGDLDLVPPGDLDLPPLGDLDLVPPGDLDLPPPSLLPPAPDDFDSPPPPLPDLDDVTPPPPPPPASEEPPWAPGSYLEKVVTLYPYARQKANELSFEAGAVIYVTRRYSDGWCEGVTDGAAGFFPGNYVEPFC